MSKKRKAKYYDIIAFIILILGGCFFSFFAMNMFITIIFNYEANWNIPYIFGILPHMVLAIEYITFLFFFARYLRLEDKYRKHHLKVYLRQFIVYSVIGIALTILGGTVSYHNFLIDNPYPGVLIVLLVVNALILAGSVTLLILLRKDERVEEKFPVTVKYGFITAAAALFVFFACNRFGAFLWSFFYKNYNKFWLTAPFYFSLLVPMIMFLLFLNPVFGFKDTKYWKRETIIWSIISLLSLSSALYTIIMYGKNPLLIALTSAAMPIERIATLPIDMILLFGVNILMPLGRVLYLLINRNKLQHEEKEN